jgi:hypothetical protein
LYSFYSTIFSVFDVFYPSAPLFGRFFPKQKAYSLNSPDRKPMERVHILFVHARAGQHTKEGGEGRNRPIFAAVTTQICLISLGIQAESVTIVHYRKVSFWCPRYVSWKKVHEVFTAPRRIQFDCERSSKISAQ